MDSHIPVYLFWISCAVFYQYSKLKLSNRLDFLCNLGKYSILDIYQLNWFQIFNLILTLYSNKNRLETIRTIRYQFNSSSQELLESHVISAILHTRFEIQNVNIKGGFNSKTFFPPNWYGMDSVHSASICCEIAFGKTWSRMMKNLFDV